MKSFVLRGQIPKQRGYLYLQEFLPDNKCDLRVTVIGSQAFGFRRMNRPNDFRASGSGMIDYDPEQVDRRAVRIAFAVSRKLGTQSLAFDFLFDRNHDPMIGEISYCYKPVALYNCPGYLDESLVWHEGHVWPQDVILENLLAQRERRDRGEALSA